MTDRFSFVIGAIARFLVYFLTGKAVISMCQKFTPEQLKNMDTEYLPFMVYDLREPFNEGRQIGIRIQHLAFECICHSGHPQGTGVHRSGVPRE